VFEIGSVMIILQESRHYQAKILQNETEKESFYR